MRYIFLSRGYPPDPSPSGSLIRNVVEVLAQTEDVVVLTFSPTDTLRVGERMDGYEVIRIPAAKSRTEKSIARLESSRHRAFHRATRLVTFAHRAGRYGVALLVPGRGGRRRKNMVASLQHLDLRPDDILVPCTAEETIACLELREHQAFRLLPFMLELFPTPNASGFALQALKGRHERRNDRIERGLLRKADRIYALPTVYRYLNDRYADAHSKLVLTEHPMLRDLSATSSVPGHEPERLAYAGGLDRTTRNPTYMLDVLGHLDEERHFEFHVYSYGNCESLIRERRYEGFVQAHGRVPPEEAIHATRQADFLVSHGNDSDSITPSKLFDYMSTGRPIIHFYYRDDDPYLKYLERYGLGCGVKVGSGLAEAISELGRFMDVSRNSRVDFESLERRFPECLPSHLSAALQRAHDEIPVDA